MKSDPPFQATEGERRRCCSACGTPYAYGKNQLGCPVCQFRRVLEPHRKGNPAMANPNPIMAVSIITEILRNDDDTLDELGRGAMGVTYRAVDTVLGHTVALKVIDHRIADLPDARERFLREARAAARLRHPNVASVFYYGMRKGDGQCFYAMELVEGETLEARLRWGGRCRHLLRWK